MRLPEFQRAIDFGTLLPALTRGCVFGAFLVAFIACGLANRTDAADKLKLKDGISYTQDIDSGFPITGESLNDYDLGKGIPTILFFGASGDLNTNRQAKRIVELYEKTKSGTLKFIVVDVDHAASEQAKSLIKNYYRGYIPAEVILDKQGKVQWSQIGEVDPSVLKHKVAEVI